jgi:hypothetical protein
MEDSNYNKIMQLLAFDDYTNFYLGIELLKSTRDPELIAKIISGKSYVSYRPGFPLVPFFQENPEIWEAVLANIPAFKAEDILKYMPHEVLFLPTERLSAFCELANQKAKEHFGNFPLLSEALLTEHEDFYCGYSKTGNNVIDGIGWSFFIESRDVGPAEVIHEEEWLATAYHPNYALKFEYQESGSMISKMWMEKIADK